MGFGPIGLMSIGALFVGAIMAAIGILLVPTEGIWAFLVGFGGLPALALTSQVLIDALRVDWSCSSITLGNEASGYVGPDGDEVMCETLSLNYHVLAAPFWVIALLGVVARLVVRRLGMTGPRVARSL